MADPKNKSFTVAPDLKADNRLTEIFIRMGIFDQEDLKARLGSLKDSEDNVISVSIEDILKAH